MKTYQTNYHVAAHWLHNSLVLCNNITAIDEELFYNDCDPLSYWEDEDGEIYNDFDDIPEDKQESANQIYEDVFQYFLTDCSASDVEYLRDNFGLKFAYSEKLDLWVLLVTHYGTGWAYVSCETKIQAAAAELGEKK